MPGVRRPLYVPASAPMPPPKRARITDPSQVEKRLMPGRWAYLSHRAQTNKRLADYAHVHWKSCVGPKRLGGDVALPRAPAYDATTNPQGQLGNALTATDSQGMQTLMTGTNNNINVSPVTGDAWFMLQINPPADMGSVAWSDMATKYEFFRVGSVRMVLEAWPYANMGDMVPPLVSTSSAQYSAATNAPYWRRTPPMEWFFMPLHSNWTQQGLAVYQYVKTGVMSSTGTWNVSSSNSAWCTPYQTDPNAAYFQVADGSAGVVGEDFSGCYFRPYVYDASAHLDALDYCKRSKSVKRRWWRSPEAGKTRLMHTWPSPNYQTEMWERFYAGNTGRQASYVKELKGNNYWQRTAFVTGNSKCYPVGVGMVRPRGSLMKFRVHVYYDVFFKGGHAVQYSSSVNVSVPDGTGVVTAGEG